ncbi:MAG: alpha/beta fold hydrolase [bacterium]
MNLDHNKYGIGPVQLIVLHGLLGSARNWHTVAQELAKHHAVLAVSLRNHGRSPHGPHTIEFMQADLLELVKTHNIDKCFVLGHSMGGLVAMSFAVERPEHLKGLVVVDIAPELRLNRIAWILEAMLQVDLSRVSRKNEADSQLAARIPHPAMRHFLLQNLKRQADGHYVWQCNLPELYRFVQLSAPNLFAENEQFHGATLFISGERSEQNLAKKSEMIRKHFPNMEFVTVPGAGHWVHVDAMPQFVDIVAEFIGRDDPGKALIL